MPVVAFCGLPGAGKSTLARALAHSTGWPRLDRDELRRELFAEGGYSEADKRLLGRAMRERMLQCLCAGSAVILDGMTFARAAERREFAAAVRLAGGAWRLVWLDCDTATARARVRADTTHLAADRDAALVDRVAERFEPPRRALRIDAALDTTRQLAALRAALGQEVSDET